MTLREKSEGMDATGSSNLPELELRIRIIIGMKIRVPKCTRELCCSIQQSPPDAAKSGALTVLMSLEQLGSQATLTVTGEDTLALHHCLCSCCCVFFI